MAISLGSVRGFASFEEFKIGSTRINQYICYSKLPLRTFFCEALNYSKLAQLMQAFYKPFVSSTTRVTTHDFVLDIGRDSEISTVSPILS